ncbi:helix-turn-helix domain-containing protein [Paenibacillus sp. GCM10027626]|uniref:helix-turn-helix domain-containing protein n=1 Tax=Paenibacillus sp. GCM10027626 TaxID=3273411 RepID=UPI0036337971
MRTSAKSPLYQKKYYMRIMISISLVAIILTGGLSTALYVYGKQTLFRIQSQHNVQVLNQARFNIELMSASIQNVAKYLFVHPDTTYILNATGNLDYDEIYRRLNRITGSVITSNTFIHSIGFFNDFHSQYYYAGKQMYYDDASLKQLIASYPNLPRMVPIFRTIENAFGKKIEQETVITYMMYETSGDPAAISSAVAINVNSDWIVDNINQISMLNEHEGEAAYIYSDSSGFLETGGTDAALRQSVLEDYLNERRDHSADSGSWEKKVNLTSHVVSYMRIPDLGLTIFKVQPSESVYRYLHAFQLYLLVIVAVFILLALFFSMKVSGIVYNPIRRLVSQAAGGQGKGMEKDEIAFLSDVYKDSFDRLQKYDSQKLDYNFVLRDYFIKSVLTGDVSRERFGGQCQEYRLDFQYDAPYYVFVAVIDDFIDLQTRYSSRDINLFKYAAINIFEETMQEYGGAVGVSLNDNDVVMLLQAGGDEEALHEQEMETIIGRFQEAVRRYYPVSLTVSVSKRVSGAMNLPAAFRHTYNLSAYRFLFGKGSRITSARVLRNKANPRQSHSPKLEAILLDNLRQGSIKGMEQAFEQLRDELAAMSYEHAIASNMHLMTAIYNELFASGRIAPQENGFADVWKSLWNYETLDDVFVSTLASLKRTFAQSDSESSTDKNIVDAVIELIRLNYDDNSLCADQIADSLGMKTRRLAQTFRQAMGMSIADYLNGVRMEKAAEMLRNSSMSVNEILVRAGYENESYFYRMFKNRYGMTPKEFALRTGDKDRNA